MEQIIAESDSNEVKTAQAASVVPLFDAAGSVNTAPPTESATMPKPEATEKRGRGRPKGSTKKAAAVKSVSPAVKEAQGVASAEIVVSSLDVLRKAVSAGECPEAPELRAATVQAWAEYFELNGWEVPPWVQVSVISIAYVSPAFTTETGKGRVSGLWAKAKGWWVARHG